MAKKASDKKDMKNLDATLQEKQRALEMTLSSIEKEFGKGTVMKLGEKTAMQVDMRVSRMRVPYFLTASTNRRVSVAVAHMRCMKLRAVLSAARMLLALPRKTSIGSFSLTMEPSGLRISTLIFGSTAFSTALATVAPATTHPPPLE